jgi:hypothetical protein
MRWIDHITNRSRPGSQTQKQEKDQDKFLHFVRSFTGKVSDFPASPATQPVSY